MNRCVWAALALASLGCGIAWAEPIVPDEGKPCYECRRAEGIVVDGRLDEQAWQQAVWTAPFIFPWEAQTGPRNRTVAALLWDDQCLYVAYRCDDNDLTAVYTERDDPTYKDDCVEIFIAARPEQSRMYYGFEMNCRGVLYDYFSAIPEAFLNEWEAAGVRLRTGLTGTLNEPGDADQGWTLEVAIPLRNFEGLSKKPRPEAGDVWRINLNRWDGTEPDRALSQWTPSGMAGANPHRPEGFGALKFVSE